MKLHIPEQIKPTADAFVSQPEQFNHWLADLPQTSMGELTRNVFNALCEHNKQVMSDDDRFDNLEMLREPLREIFNNLKKHFTNRTLPLPEKSQKIVNLNQSLLREVAIGYKILIANIANDENDNKDMISTAICRAIRYQSELLLRASEVYAQSPAGTWLDLHTIYDYADKIGVTKNTINDSESESETATIEDYYKQILLFALARPIALRQRDTELMYRKLSEWAELTEISNTPDDKEIKRIFCVRVEQDRPPTYLKQEDCENTYPVRTLNAARLSESIQNNLNEIDLSNTEYTFGDDLSPETLQVLASSWGIFAKRRFTRSARIGQISASIGVSSAAKAIKNDDAIRKAADPLYKQHSRTLRKQLNSSLELLDAKQSEKADTKQGEDTDKPTPESHLNDLDTTAFNNNLQSNQDDVDSYWKIANVSAGGYCLRWNSDETSKAQIGELIALRESEANGSFQWRVGAIRWMQYTREHGLEIGVQLLSPHVCPAIIKRKNSPDKSSANCIMLPGINPLKLPATILLASHSYKINDCLEFNTLGQIMEIRLIDIKEKTGSFTQFVFTKTETAIKPHNTDRKWSEGDIDDFAEIWSSL